MRVFDSEGAGCRTVVATSDAISICAKKKAERTGYSVCDDPGAKLLSFRASID